MKVLYVSPYPPAQDGIGNYTSMFTNAVRNAGHDVRVIVPRGSQNAPPEVMGAVSGRTTELARLLEAVTQWDPDVVHIQFAIAAFGTRTRALMRWLDMAHRNLSIPLVVTLHEVTRESAMLPGVGKYLFRWIAARCDLLIVHTRVALDALSRAANVPPSKVIVIPHPSAQPPAATSSADDLRARFDLGNARILLAFGFIHVDKGLGDLVEALCILRRTRPTSLDGVRLVVAGAVRPRNGLFRIFEARDSLYLSRAMRRAKRNKLSDLIVLTGYVPAGEVGTWFDIAESVVMPYRRIEQSGVASLARSFNVPVLASTVGGLAEQFAGSQWSFPPRAPARLADTLARFLAATSAERLETPSARRADDLATVTSATLDIYRQVTAQDGDKVSHAS